ncbi:MAG: PqqD family protein [Acidobacteria bacterium]|nr:PqqD family protein [Acidobacteriota bacterium]
MPWTITKHVAWQRIGETAVVVDLQSGTSLGLNPSGSLIWTLLPDHTLPEIVAELEREFQVDEETATTDARAFIAMLEERRLATPAPVP